MGDTVVGVETITTNLANRTAHQRSRLFGSARAAGEAGSDLGIKASTLQAKYK